MRNNNRRLVILVASVAVAAVAVGAAFAYRQGPQNATADTAAPLTGSPSPTPKPSAKPSSTPTTVKPTTTPKPTSAPATSTGPVKTAVNLAKLTQGRVPQITYRSGRTVLGGGLEIKIPGTADIVDIARINNDALAVVTTGNGYELLRVDSTGDVRRTPDVSQIVSAEGYAAVAYVATKRSDSGQELPGAVVYAEGDGQVRKVTVPDVIDTFPLGYVDGTVYFQAKVNAKANTWNLYQWRPGAAKATVVKTVPSPTGLSWDAKTAASMISLTDYGSCTNVVEVATGKRLWRTCEYGVSGFTPDGATAIGQPFYLDGYANGLASALDTKDGKLIHEWTGTFRQTVAEDDQHLLILADDGEESPEAIIRCTIPTGACELATPLSKTSLALAD